MDKWNVEEMDELIKQMRRLAEALREKGCGIQAVERNVDRILTGIRMLELNISDVKGLI